MIKAKNPEDRRPTAFYVEITYQMLRNIQENLVDVKRYMEQGDQKLIKPLKYVYKVSIRTRQERVKLKQRDKAIEVKIKKLLHLLSSRIHTEMKGKERRADTR